MRLIVSGAPRYDDKETVFKILTRETWCEDEVILIADQLPDKEWKSSFELGQEWLQSRFVRGHRKFNKVIRHYPPFSGQKKWSVGVHHMRVNMVQDADTLIAFKDVGANDFHTNELIRLAKLFDLKVKVYLV